MCIYSCLQKLLSPHNTLYIWSVLWGGFDPAMHPYTVHVQVIKIYSHLKMFMLKIFVILYVSPRYLALEAKFQTEPFQQCNQYL